LWVARVNRVFTGAVLVLLATVLATQALMVGSYVHPMVQKPVTKPGAGDRAADQVVNSTARR
jgi:hypothetical protein